MCKTHVHSNKISFHILMETHALNADIEIFNVIMISCFNCFAYNFIHLEQYL